MTEIQSRLFGSITALVTPFDESNGIDEKVFCELVERQIEAGTHGLVPVGSTGESPTLSHDEHRQIVKLCVEVAAGRVPVIAGAGSNSTREATSLAKFAEEVGADAILSATGYYNRPQQEGVIAHFKAIHDAVSLPIVLYNVPGRTTIDVTVETLATLSKLERVVALKDATGDLARVAQQRIACDQDFIQLSGEDMTAIGFNAMGGKGCISVLANVVPELCVQLQQSSLAGDYETALQLQDRLTPLIDALFSTINPVPVKYAMSRLGLCRPNLRLPLSEIDVASKKLVDDALDGLSL